MPKLDPSSGAMFNCDPPEGWYRTYYGYVDGKPFAYSDKGQREANATGPFWSVDRKKVDA